MSQSDEGYKRHYRRFEALRHMIEDQASMYSESDASCHAYRYWWDREILRQIYDNSLGRERLLPVSRFYSYIIYYTRSTFEPFKIRNGRAGRVWYAAGRKEREAIDG